MTSTKPTITKIISLKKYFYKKVSNNMFEKKRRGYLGINLGVLRRREVLFVVVLSVESISSCILGSHAREQLRVWDYLCKKN
jgi:hypothetical protein